MTMALLGVLFSTSHLAIIVTNFSWFSQCSIFKKIGIKVTNPFFVSFICITIYHDINLYEKNLALQPKALQLI